MNKIKLKGLSDKRYAMSELVGDAYRLNSNKISILAGKLLNFWQKVLNIKGCRRNNKRVLSPVLQ